MASSMKYIRQALGVQHAKRDIQSPYVTANPISKATLWWMNNHVWRGFKRPLSPTDIYSVVQEEASERRAERLSREWKCLTPEEQKKKHSLLKTVVLNDWRLFVVSVALIALGEVAKFVQPFLIAEIVSFFKGEGYVNEGEAWGYAFGMVMLTMFYSVVSTYGQFLGQIVAMRWRTSCTALMSRKASRLSSKALSELSSGTVINLLATDVEKFYNAASEFRGLFVGPLVLVALLIIMAVTVELSIIPALVFVALLTTFRMYIGNVSGRIRLKLADWSDKRIQLVTEIVSSMMMIKAYCWEKVFGAQAQELRGYVGIELGKEVRSAGWVIFFNCLNLILGYTCDKVVTCFLVITFVLSGHIVKYKLALQLLAWMKLGQLGFLNFPVGYSMWKQMEASLSRIQKFLLAEEFTGYKRIRKESTVTSAHQIKIVMKDVGASWAVSEKHHTESQKMMKQSLLRSISAMNIVTTRETFVASGTFSLRNISLEVKNGQLVGLVGPVGSGKTSLLLVILGNLKIGAGVRRLKGKIAYVPQRPWIRADTVRNNILMGEKMERSRYSDVLKACALQKDIAAMANGDSTQIGDKGSSLSGGQRARISLARAVYRNADIYILDDPFSSLDSKVGTHIFDECVRGLLKGKLIIMATHYVHLLKYVDHVLVLKEGRMLASGTLDNVKSAVNLRELIKDPEHNMLDRTEIHDVFEKEDKKNLLMPLLRTDHIEKEHAHVPKKRTTPTHVYINYWKAGYGPILMTLFCILLITQQALAILGEYWLVYRLSADSYKKGGYNKNNTYGGHDYNKSTNYDYNSYGGKYEKTTLGYAIADYSTVGRVSDASTSMTEAYHSMSNIDSSPSSLLTTESLGNILANGSQWMNDYLNSTLVMGSNHTSSFTVLDADGTQEVNFAAASTSKVTVDDQKAILGTYSLYIMLSVLMGLLAVLAGSLFMVMAARNLYNSMFTKILWAPMKTFSSDRTGEMVNRFARDTGRMDDIIPITINATFVTAAIILSQAAYISLVNHYVILATLPFLVGLTLFVMYCVRSIRDTKRLESEFRTPTFEHLQHLLNGLEVIRAFEMEVLMIEESDKFLDRHTAAWHLYIGAMYWMKMRLNWLVSIYLAVVLLIALASPHQESMATPLGLSLSYIIVFMARVQYFATYSTMLDANMTSVEHVSEYDHLEQEPPCHTDHPLPPSWPTEAHIQFRDIELIYPGSKTHALRGITFDVRPGNKIGIVGRTGAGKSSLFNVLLRFQSYGGVIEIDGVDISKIGLTDLRSKIAFILQEPTLSSGTLRHNLDPFEKFTDEDLWAALEKVRLKRKVQKLPGRLDMEIEDGGNNFSGGQKQLLCMARALLSMKKIMLLDEITANVDKETDTLLHNIINDEFRDCTILHISHRIETLIEYDNILVSNSSSVVEFDHPHVLLQNPNGQFYSMVQQLGKCQAELLTEIAFESYTVKHEERRKRISIGSESNLSDPGVDIYSENDEEFVRNRAPVVRRLSEHLHNHVNKSTTMELRLAKMAVLIENRHRNGHIVHDVMTRPAQTSSSSNSEKSSASDLQTEQTAQHTDQNVCKNHVKPKAVSQHHPDTLEESGVAAYVPPSRPDFKVDEDNDKDAKSPQSESSPKTTCESSDSGSESDESDIESSEPEVPTPRSLPPTYRKRIRTSSQGSDTTEQLRQDAYAQHVSVPGVPKLSSASIESGRRAVKRARLLSVSIKRNDSWELSDFEEFGGKRPISHGFDNKVFQQDSADSSDSTDFSIDFSAPKLNGGSHFMNGNSNNSEPQEGPTFKYEDVALSDSEDGLTTDSPDALHPRIAFPSKTVRPGTFVSTDRKNKANNKRSTRVRFQDPKSNGRDNPSFTLGE